LATDTERQIHAAHAARAKELYVQSRTPQNDAIDWNDALEAARSLISDTLRSSQGLSDVAGAVQSNGLHTLVLRHLTAPPISQDQFKLVCPLWRKGSEKPGGRVTSTEAQAIAAAFEQRRSRTLTTWLDHKRSAQRFEQARLLWSIAPLIASQQVSTIQRTRAANIQESAVVALLDSMGWTREPARLLDTRAALPLKHYMHKTRYATASGAPQEVDLAMGLGNTVVLAMECKVSNDQTNSIKRVNDVLKKATAWHQHWGSFVKTAALLQGVIEPRDVWRLLDAGVEVFWSHNLQYFQVWLETKVESAGVTPQP